MGWKHGKGLGLNENGILEHVKVSYKNDSRGMGFMEQTEQWTEHQEGFNKLLENLKGDNEVKKDTKVKAVSLEEKSLKSRARVHYHKFTRGKDLSRYSDKDLANILGKKTLKEIPKKNEEEIMMENDKDVEDESSKSFGVETVRGGSMADYFKKKLPNFSMSNNGYNIGSNGVLQGSNVAVDNSDSECERPALGFGFNSNAFMQLDQNLYNTKIFENEAEEATPITKKKKAKSLKDSFISFISENNSTNVNTNENGEDVCDSHTEPQKVKKKKSKETEKKSNFVSYIQEESVVNEEVESHKTNKKKWKSDKVNEDENVVESKKRKLEPQEDGNKKSKKRRQVVDLGISNPAFDPMSRNVIVEKHILQPINEDVADVSQVELEETTDVNDSTQRTEDNKKVEKAKKRKKKKKNELNGYENPTNDVDLDAENEEPSSLEHSNNTYELKEKTKKSKKRKGNKEDDKNYAIDNPCFDANTKADAGNTELDENNFEVQRKKKKKKKKHQQQEVEEETVKDVSKPESNQNDNEIECDLILNVSTKVIATITSDVKLEESKRPPPKRRKSVRFSDVHEERIIPNNDELRELSIDQNKIDLFNINTEVIENGLKEQAKKDGKKGIVNTGFDMRSIDRISFYERSHVINNGIENVGFNENAIKIEESVIGIKKKLDNYQAEIENDINEAKVTTVKKDNVIISESEIVGVEEYERHVGIVTSNREENETTEEGVLLAFKKAKFGKEPRYTSAHTGPKKSYKHLIRGDIILKFPKANLHEIDGYGNFLKCNNK